MRGMRVRPDDDLAGEGVVFEDLGMADRNGPPAGDLAIEGDAFRLGEGPLLGFQRHGHLDLAETQQVA